MTRMFTGTARVAPTGSTSRSDSTRSSRACSASGMSPISSRKSVPPSASWTRPRLPLAAAPEKLPGRWPKSSLSISASGMAAQFTATKGRARRSLLACTALAKTSLPAPVSPVMSRLIGEFTSRATRSTWRSSCGSPADRAAIGAGRRGGAPAPRGAACSAGGGVADRNSTCRPPACITARWSEGCVCTKRPTCSKGTPNRASKRSPMSVGAASRRSPSCAARLWPTTRPAASSASRNSGCTSRNCGARDSRSTQSRWWRCRKAAFSMSCA